eukprot:CAMPEP_0181206434 /NCGR_PEP_ID=MMETSP1096-20121128/21033_1 /TAXON_ID=156174 ORGANISM="Chrysochromulina ericina, Strain CCMP281" /NCGR_SAMPLE_ID=MMETSP1096 /ASSEMBLY_ACC=CAM_ASM_000453 /LENGTH=166 /DNA_ID=CAMNT_0023297333 /DNA_START=621 /DNA_END=1120 /DNA_ORIENTATION=+
MCHAKSSASKTASIAPPVRTHRGHSVSDVRAGLRMAPQQMHPVYEHEETVPSSSSILSPLMVQQRLSKTLVEMLVHLEQLGAGRVRFRSEHPCLLFPRCAEIRDNGQYLDERAPELDLVVMLAELKRVVVHAARDQGLVIGTQQLLLMFSAHVGVDRGRKEEGNVG